MKLSHLILAFLNCAGSIFYGCGLTGCANLSPEGQAALIRAGESAAIRVLDSKFPPAHPSK